jgi:hypothetical protein
MASPFTTYTAYKIGTGNVRSVDAGAERRAGRLETCLYFAERAEIEILEAQSACEQLVSELERQ